MRKASEHQRKLIDALVMLGDAIEACGINRDEIEVRVPIDDVERLLWEIGGRQGSLSTPADQVDNSTLAGTVGGVIVTTTGRRKLPTTTVGWGGLVTVPFRGR
ncbi:MAG: hypothetical protein QM773_13775 [Hyphomonadaceae bacterium]